MGKEYFNGIPFFAIYIMYTYIINNKGEEERYADNISTQEEDKISAAV